MTSGLGRQTKADSTSLLVKLTGTFTKLGVCYMHIFHLEEIRRYSQR